MPPSPSPRPPQVLGRSFPSIDQDFIVFDGEITTVTMFVETFLNEFFDQVARHSGHARSRNFNPDGSWKRNDVYNFSFKRKRVDDARPFPPSILESIV